MSRRAQPNRFLSMTDLEVLRAIYREPGTCRQIIDRVSIRISLSGLKYSLLHLLDLRLADQVGHAPGRGRSAVVWGVTVNGRAIVEWTSHVGSRPTAENRRAS